MNYLLLVILLLTVVFSQDGMAKKRHRHSKSKDKDHKIVGGYNTTIQDYPYQAFLLLQKNENDMYQCGGSIISSQYIVSAAHCFENIQLVKARIGSTDKFYGGREYPASYFKIHPKYDSVSKDYDIAIVKTDDEMELDGTNAKAVSLVDEGISIPPGSIVKLSGWGATSEGGDTSRYLMATEVPVISNDECNKIEKVTSRQFCGGYKEGGKDTCQGDSGGPVVLADSGLLCGVVSAGYGCARPNQPGIYSNVTTLRRWIKRETGI